MDVAELDVGGWRLRDNEDRKGNEGGDREGYGREEAEDVLEPYEGRMHCGEENERGF